FGVVTRFWFRSPDATGADPTTLLPRAPQSITTFKAQWEWSELDESAFLRLVTQHGAWCEQNRGADSPNATLWTLLQLHRRQLGMIVVRGVSTDRYAEPQFGEHLRAIGDGVATPRGFETERRSWLEFVLNPLPDLFAMPAGGVSTKVKDALLRKPFTESQIRAAYHHL